MLNRSPIERRDFCDTPARRAHALPPAGNLATATATVTARRKNNRNLAPPASFEGESS
jgi:hypothetical protein